MSEESEPAVVPVITKPKGGQYLPPFKPPEDDVE